MFAAGSLCSMKSQVVLSEDFNSPFALSATGWTVQNNSVPTSTTTWFQGSAANFNAYNGSPDDYYAVNFNSTTGNGDISNWLISPTVTIYDGAVVQFATRTIGPVGFPDRLQLRMSQTAAYTIPTGTASTGSFTDLLLDINPNQSTVTASSVNNGTVNGFPTSWTVYSVQIAGVTGTVTGRFALRYLVSDSGPQGNNGNFVGVDAFRYTLPCGISVQSQTVCAGTSATLTALGGLPSTTYMWDNMATTSSIVVNPSSTTVYTVAPGVGTTPCGNYVTATVSIGSSIPMSINASSTTVCEGRTITLSADGQATNYLWGTAGGTSPLGMTQAITQTVNSTTTYTVGGLNGTCTGSAQITINALPNPTVSFTKSAPVSCPSSSLQLTGNGAASYLWILGTQGTTMNPLGLTTGTNPAGGTFSLILVGYGSNGCGAAVAVNHTIAALPTITASVSKSIECINRTITLNATGIDTYTWTGASTSSAQSFTFNTGATAGTKSWTVTGASPEGCVAAEPAVVTMTVSLCTGIDVLDASQPAEVYPNPFTDHFFMSGLNGSVEIFNSAGQLVLKQQVNGKAEIGTQNLPKGFYILKARNEDGNIIKSSRLLKN